MQRQEIWFSAISDMKNSIYNKDEAFQLFRKRVDTYQKNKMMRKRLRWKIVYKYVAFISIIGFISYFSYWRGKSNLKNVLTETGIEVETPIGSQTRLRLPDGTIVILMLDHVLFIHKILEYTIVMLSYKVKVILRLLVILKCLFM